MPIGWVGHALCLIMRKGEVEGTFDFAVVNTGQGIQYHYHSADPNGVYPKLTQIWMEFKQVEAEELFTEEAWFFYGLIALKQKSLQLKLKQLFTPPNESEYSEYFPEYFYGSFLANFKKYLVPRREDRLFPMQRSGSCALSSLIGALLYVSRSEDIFYLYRLKIGHALIKLFLVKAQVNDRFKTIITDGFETNGRNLLTVNVSSLAQKTLEYLEFVLPKHFKHAGLIGSERFKWIFEKKEAAREALMNTNAVVLESIKISIDLINQISSFLKENPIRNASNDIVLTEEIRTRFKPHQVNLTSSTIASGTKLSIDFYAFLKGKCDRPEEPFLFFNQFYQAIKQFDDLKSADMQVNYHALNVFQRAHNLLKHDTWLESVTEPQLIDLQDFCKKLAHSFSIIKDIFKSFDDIVLLAYLQKISWKTAVTYDNT